MCAPTVPISTRVGELHPILTVYGNYRLEDSVQRVRPNKEGLIEKIV
jgi:hypothetical protein